ncbi:hypothetical protein M8C21_019323, partial [Ambrosia artemisiifolia]
SSFPKTKKHYDYVQGQQRVAIHGAALTFEVDPLFESDFYEQREGIDIVAPMVVRGGQRMLFGLAHQVLGSLGRVPRVFK